MDNCEKIFKKATDWKVNIENALIVHLFSLAVLVVVEFSAPVTITQTFVYLAVNAVVVYTLIVALFSIGRCAYVLKKNWLMWFSSAALFYIPMFIAPFLFKKDLDKLQIQLSS